MAARKQKEKVLFDLDWDVDGDIIEDLYAEMLYNLPSVKNDVIAEGIYGESPIVRSFLPELIQFISDGYPEGVSIINGDLYVNGRLVRELTDKGQKWWDNNTYFESSNEEEAEHIMATPGYTRKIFSDKNVNTPKIDISKYFDAERHPLSKWKTKSKLFTIDRGPGYGDYRYLAANDSLGSDGLPGKIGSEFRREGGSFDSGYNEGERLQDNLGVGESRPVGKGMRVTRVRNTKPKSKTKDMYLLAYPSPFGSTWEHQFEETSDKKAIKCAKKYLKSKGCSEGILSVYRENDISKYHKIGYIDSGLGDNGRMWD